MVTDEELAELLKRATTELEPPTSRLVSQAEQQGRRLKRKRLAWIAGGNATAVVAIAGLATYLQLPISPPAPAHSISAGGSRSASDGAPATPSPSVTTPPERAKPMTRKQMLSALRSLLPAGSVFTHLRAHTTPGNLEVNYNDGHGEVDIMVDIMPFSEVVTPQQASLTTAAGRPLPTVLALSCPTPLWKDEGRRPDGALPISCQVRKLPDGSIERDAVMYADEFGFYGYGLYDQRPDGIEVFIQVGNGYFDPYLPHVDRPRPPGSMQLWQQVVESPRWHG